MISLKTFGLVAAPVQHAVQADHVEVIDLATGSDDLRNVLAQAPRSTADVQDPVASRDTQCAHQAFAIGVAAVLAVLVQIGAVQAQGVHA